MLLLKSCLKSHLFELVYFMEINDMRTTKERRRMSFTPWESGEKKGSSVQLLIVKYLIKVCARAAHDSHSEVLYT